MASIPARIGFVAAALVASMALAGPPLICHPFEIDGARSMAWGDGPFDAPRIRDQGAMIEQVIGILDSDPAVLVRMETLRRATIACARKSGAPQALLTRLLARALDAEAARTPDALAWFDVGFFAQSLDQYGDKASRDVGVKDGIIGYAYVSRAIELHPRDTQMQFAAALVTSIHDQDLCNAHMAKARSGAADDALLAANITRFRSELGEHLDHHRSNYRHRAGG